MRPTDKRARGMVTSPPRSAPSEQGVDARGVIAFLDAVEAAGMDLHSLMVLRHGVVVVEGWWAPYRAADIQLLYSLSKTFTAMAVGIAVGEGRLSTDDLVAGLLPDLVPEPLPDHLRQLRVRHLLSMASGHREETLLRLAMMGPDLVRNFLSLPPEEAPGAVFAYNQGNPITLSAIITTLTGARLVEYLRPRLFDPLGIDDAEWLFMSTGIDQGFSGLHVTTESVVKLGQLLLQGGRWEGAQVVPARFVAECRRSQIDNARQFIDPDWQQGYGYQMWMCRHDAQRGDGAFGQFAIVLPEQDAVIACTAQVVDMQSELDIIWEHLLPALSSTPADPAADEELADRLARLSTRTIESASPGPGEPVEFAVAPVAEPYTDRVEAIRVEPVEGGSRMLVRVSGTEHVFDLRPGEWADGHLPGLHTPFPEVSVTGGWVNAEEFHADVVSRRTPHRLQLRATAGTSPTVSVSWYAAPLPLPAAGY
jgi:CubicO group peptidase (beta-lactamase class C family)